jgi:glycerol uptake facilitator-like aquaporin
MIKPRTKEQMNTAQKESGTMLFRGYNYEYIAEFLGTMLLLWIGGCSNASSLLSNGTWSQGVQGPLTWGLALYFGVLISSNLSGGHLNPAVTITMAVHGKVAWERVPWYIFAQCLGAFTGSVLCYLQYFSAISTYGGGQLLIPPTLGATAGIFTTFPNQMGSVLYDVIPDQESEGISYEELMMNYPSKMQCFGDQIIGTFFLVFAIFALTDRKGPISDAHSVPFGIGLAITAIGSAYGLNCNYALNPARDFGPRVFCMLVGYGSDVFSKFDGYFVVPLVGPIVGALLGGFVYQFFIAWQRPKDNVEEEARNSLDE